MLGSLVLERYAMGVGGEGGRKTSKGKKGMSRAEKGSRWEKKAGEKRRENERWYSENAPMHPAMRHGS